MFDPEDNDVVGDSLRLAADAATAILMSLFLWVAINCAISVSVAIFFMARDYPFVAAVTSLSVLIGLFVWIFNGIRRQK